MVRGGGWISRKERLEKNLKAGVTIIWVSNVSLTERKMLWVGELYYLNNVLAVFLFSILWVAYVWIRYFSHSGQSTILWKLYVSHSIKILESLVILYFKKVQVVFYALFYALLFCSIRICANLYIWVWIYMSLYESSLHIPLENYNLGQNIWEKL